MNIDIQPVLQNDNIILYPLRNEDFEELYAVASDPKVWEQHPSKDRWQREIFQTFFEGALQSKGAFRIVEKATGKTIGSTRFYDHNPENKSILIGYTFYATKFWGTGVNHAVKAMMLDYIFQFVESVCFHIGAGNLRSQISIGRIGAEKIDEEQVSYYGEAPKLNFIYKISKKNWQARK